MRKTHRARVFPELTAVGGPEAWRRLLQLVRDEAVAKGETDFALIVDLAILHAEVLIRQAGAVRSTPPLHS